MKILVTGGAGFIGTNLIKLLLKNGHIVHSLDNYDSGLYSNHQEGCEYHQGDINNINLMDKDFNLIFHLAGLSRIQPSYIQPEVTFKVNTEGTLSACEFARQIGAKLVYAGSSSRWHNPYLSPYACFKHLGEEICKMYKISFDVNIEIARFYNVYGPYEIVEGDWAAVIGKWRGQIEKNQPIMIVGDGEQRRDFTHVDDIVDGLFKIGLTYYKHEDAWELGTGKNYSVNEVADMFIKKFNCVKEYIPNQKGNYRKTLRENDDTLKKLLWNPKDRLQEYINSL
jgi:UDP-glucose 4-epimerase